MKCNLKKKFNLNKNINNNHVQQKDNADGDISY